MSSRFPARPREELRRDRQEFRDHFHDTVAKKAPHPGAADRATATLFPVLAVLPKLGKANVDLMGLLESETAGFVSGAARETVSIVATTFFQSKYVDFVHRKMAVDMDLLSQSQADTMGEGKKPDDLSEECSLAYDLAHHSLAVRGPVPQELWERCVAQFGEEGTIGLVHYVCLMTWTSLTMNAADLQMPSPPKATLSS